jgi:MFS family permease
LIRLRTRSTVTVAAIGMTQTLAWGSSYYLPAILADPIATGLDVPKSLFFGFFSGSLLLQAALGPMIGRAIDRHGGRGVLVLSNLVLGAGLVWLAFAQGPVGLAGAWAALGIGMALGLYDAAFATLTALFGHEARGPITGITLIAGFASTVGWPLSALGNGLLTISRGTLPLALFGPAGYGLRTGIIAAPARVTTAAAPLLFGLLLNVMGTGALVVSGGLSLAALASLALLRVQPAEAAG